MTVAPGAELVLSEVQGLLARLEKLCAQIATGPDVAVMPTVVSSRQVNAERGTGCQSLRDLRLERGWSQSHVIVRLRRLANEELPYDLLNQYKRWERGRHAPSRFYARLLCSVFDVNDIAFDLPVRRVAHTARVGFVGQAA